jgi:hypothetical protein
MRIAGKPKGTDSASIVQLACNALTSEGAHVAEAIIRQAYPFEPLPRHRRSYTDQQALSIFIRDGYIDRYTGQRLVHPCALRVLSQLMPQAFPYHRNGKMDECHVAYWELFPTIDHVVPIAIGGSDEPDNWTTCSMLTNSIKSNWSLSDLGWSFLPPGNLREWDGLMAWFLNYVEQDRSVLDDAYIKRWHAATLRAMSTP